jgi:hypothetical protein
VNFVFANIRWRRFPDGSSRIASLDRRNVRAEAEAEGRKKYPLVLMLEPLFRCNLACAGCGKIQYPAHIPEGRADAEECFKAVEECGTPMVAIPGGEPLLHPQMPEIVAGWWRARSTSTCAPTRCC